MSRLTAHRYEHDLFKDIYCKLEQLEDLEEEIGIDFITLVKMLKDDVYINDGGIVDEICNIYKEKVKWNGDHYSAGFEVKGSKIEKREDGTTWLFDDEPIQEFPFYGDGRDELVDVDETTVVRLK